ncbi:MAG: hypothetical protein RL321_1067 [Pseudomonadota bacterium]|jgi:membrane protein implicated in regulation of membrane protease activity
MTSEQYSRFALFTAIGAVVWIGFLPIYDLLFAWTEFVPGINWIYLPHGLRMMLVLLLGPAGALGFTIGAAVHTRYSEFGPHLDPWLDLVLSVVPGLAAWLAVMLTFRQWPGQSLQPLVFDDDEILDGRRLLLLAFVSAILNSTFHITARYALGSETHEWADLLVAMFVGDLFGALLLLYTLKGCIFLLENRNATLMHHERKAKSESR